MILIVSDLDAWSSADLFEKICRTHLRDFLRPKLSVATAALDLLFPLILLEDQQLAMFLYQSQAQPFFAISWLLTWFSHNLFAFETVAKLFDFFITSHPLMPLYMCAAVILSKRADILQLECEISEIHQFFQNNLSTITEKEFSGLFIVCQDMFDRHTPVKLMGLAGNQSSFPDE